MSVIAFALWGKPDGVGYEGDFRLSAVFFLSRQTVNHGE